MSDTTRIEELRKEIESLCGNCDRPDKEQLDEIILSSMAYGFSVGLDAPSADRPQGWIPCSERLPSKGIAVLVNGIVYGAPPITISADAPHDYEKGWINAWMPLPERWKGADDGAN